MASDEGTESDHFREHLARRCSARKAFIEADNSSSLRRALLKRTRPLRGPFEIGDWVLYWRRKGANLRRARGRWFGPASVVATEGSRNVWLNHCGKLVRASPEQLRPASFREWNALKLQSDQGNGSPSKVFPQPLKSGVFIDLDQGDIPDGDDASGYSPSIMEPDGELSVDMNGEREREGAEGQEEQFSGWKVPIPESPFESGEENEDPVDHIDGGDGSEEDSLLFGDDVVFGGDCFDDVWETDVPLEFLWSQKKNLCCSVHPVRMRACCWFPIPRSAKSKSG